MRRLLLSIIVAAAAFPLSPASLFAQGDDLLTHRSTLTKLYEQLARDPKNEYLAKRIDTELRAVREIIGEESSGSLDIGEEEDLPVTDPSKAVERQQRMTDALSDRLREHRVDLELLNEEEKLYEGKENPPDDVGAESFRLTKSHAELKAHRAILQQRIGALEGVLSLSEERLGKLRLESRAQRFGLLIEIGKYLGILLLAGLLERLIRTQYLLRIARLEHRYFAIKAFGTGIYALAILWITGSALSKRPEIITSFAIIGAGIAIALQDVVKDAFGWFMILQNRLFLQGQRVTIGGTTGDVVDIGVLRTKLLEVKMDGEVQERTGKILSLPNAAVLTQNVVNHHATSDFVRAEMRITVTLESNWRRAETIFQNILKKETVAYAEQELEQHKLRTRTYYIPKHTRGPVVHMNIASDGVEFTLRFSVPIGERRPVITRISRRILEACEEHRGIELAYRTSRVFSATYVPVRHDDAADG